MAAYGEVFMATVSPAQSDRSERSTHQQLALNRQQALIPAVSHTGAHLPLP
jgi:hypothetical protein